MASLATAATERASIEMFRRDVIEASATRLVIVDFWAPWCGPCKTLTPLIERVVATYGARVGLVKIDIDRNATLAQQFRIQSVPTVYAFAGGQPVDGFAGALGERELKAFIDRALAAAPALPATEEDLTPLVEAGLAALTEGATDDALQIFEALAEQAPDRADVAAGLARALVANGRADDAIAMLDLLPADAARDAAVGQARAAALLARDAAPPGELERLAAAAAAAPEDRQAAFDHAAALVAAGERDAAANALLALIAEDRDWNEGAAKVKLLQLFEAVGLADPWVLATRRRLAAILFA